MTTLTKAAAQWPLSAVFIFDIGATGGADAMVNTATPGVLTSFKASSGATFDIATLPANSFVVSGEINVVTVSNDTGTATISVGDPSSATRYLGATTIKVAGRTALVPTGLLLTASTNLRITLANANGDATTGKVIVRADIVILGRVNENLKMV